MEGSAESEALLEAELRAKASVSLSGTGAFGGGWGGPAGAAAPRAPGASGAELEAGALGAAQGSAAEADDGGPATLPPLSGARRAEALTMVEEEYDPSIGAGKDAVQLASSAMCLQSRGGELELQAALFPQWLFSTDEGGMLEAARKHRAELDGHADIPDKVEAALGAPERYMDMQPEEDILGAAMRCIMKLSHQRASAAACRMLLRHHIQEGKVMQRAAETLLAEKLRQQLAEGGFGDSVDGIGTGDKPVGHKHGKAKKKKKKQRKADPKRSMPPASPDVPDEIPKSKVASTAAKASDSTAGHSGVLHPSSAARASSAAPGSGLSPPVDAAEEAEQLRVAIRASGQGGVRAAAGRGGRTRGGSQRGETADAGQGEGWHRPGEKKPKAKEATGSGRRSASGRDGKGKAKGGGRQQAGSRDRKSHRGDGVDSSASSGASARPNPTPGAPSSRATTTTTPGGEASTAPSQGATA